MNAVVRAGFRTLSTISPTLAARAAGRLWFRIPKSRAGETAQAFLATGERFTVDVDGRSVAAWRWGTGPAVILMHGWGGHAGQFQSLIQGLTERGIASVTFDAPSHGQSAPGALGAHYSTLFEFAAALRVIESRTRETIGVVAHSGGSAAVAWAMANEPKLELRRVAFVAPFARPLKYMELFRRTLGLTPAALERFQRITEAQFGFQWSDLEVPEMTRLFTPPPTLVVHDREDRETMWQDGADIAAAWPGATLMSTTGLGHNRILRDPGVVGAICDHLLKGTA
jgi:pimeloyl-ACP methyl ester carboxylesterase